ncbi:hypothetical protein OsI_23101 [Oryza sativa Indica Group]|uniref:Uncharacterized protein n=1 Tax=Oryza sativa subsp. indica TaxID=39946 RepID=A2YDB1_ORYSI|nr:hypothetical protein OsI_23101 [Oryza sativa Indica Group]
MEADISVEIGIIGTLVDDGPSEDEGRRVDDGPEDTMMGAKNMLRRLMGEVGEKARGVKWREDEWKGGRHLKY